MGDNSQSDPAIYAKVVEKYGDRIYAVYIRNVRKENYNQTATILSSLESQGIHTLQFSHSQEAIQHSASIGLIELPASEQINTDTGKVAEKTK